MCQKYLVKMIKNTVSVTFRGEGGIIIQVC